MKMLFISDIHGISDNLEYIERIIIDKKIDKLVVLGDLYYNDLPYTEENENKAQKVKDFLNKHKNILICMRGNCDSIVDVMSSEFLIIDGLSLIYIDDLNIYLNHGHIYNKNKNKGFNKGILVYGHEHIPYIEKKDNMIYINVGSISLPRDGNDPTYMIYENKEFTIYDIYGNIVSNFRI